MLTLILNEFGGDDKSIARYGQWPYSHNIICTTCKGISLMDVGFGAKLLTFKSQFYHFLDRKPWVNYIMSHHCYL